MKESSVTISQDEYKQSINAFFAIEIIRNLKGSVYTKENVISVIRNTLLGLEVTHDAEETGDRVSDDE